MTIIFDGNASDGLVLEGWAPSDFPFSLAADALPPVITDAGSTTSVTVDDVDYIDHTGASGYTNAQAVADDSGAWDSLTPAVGTVDSAGLITRLADGLCRVGFDSGRGKRSAEVVLSSFTGESTRSFDGFHAGSASRAAADTIDGLIAGKTPATVQPIFSAADHVMAQYTRNTQCLIPVDQLTPQSVWNSRPTFGAASCASLVTPRHAIIARHHGSNTGDVERFVGPDNTVYNRTVIDRADLVDDLSIVLYDADLPPAVGFYQVLDPTSWPDYFKTLGAYTGSAGTPVGVPVFFTNQVDKVSLAEWYAERVFSSVAYMFIQNPSGDRANFTQDIIVGDSSSGVVLSIDGVGVLLFTLKGGSQQTATGVSIAHYFSSVNSTLALLDAAHSVTSGYQLTPFDASSYTFYG